MSNHFISFSTLTSHIHSFIHFLIYLLLRVLSPPFHMLFLLFCCCKLIFFDLRDLSVNTVNIGIRDISYIKFSTSTCAGSSNFPLNLGNPAQTQTPETHVTTLVASNTTTTSLASSTSDSLSLLCVGSTRGEILLYDPKQKVSHTLPQAKHKKKINAIDWNNQNKFAFASEDRQVSKNSLFSNTHHSCHHIQTGMKKDSQMILFL